MSGAKIAAKISTAMKTMPTIAPGLWIMRRQASRQSPVGASSWISWASISATLMRRESSG